MHILTFAFVCFLFTASARDLRQEFDAYKTQFSKYYTAEEHEVRFENFVNSINRIEAKNTLSQGEGATFGLNKFSDMTTEEWKGKYLSKVPTTSGDRNVVAPKVQAPSTLDWRKSDVVTKVKNQEQCGSCWAFSATETIESAWMMAKKVTNLTFAPLAPQQIVDCDNSDGGCNGGNPYTAYEYVISAGGLDKESAYPYTGTDGTCAFKQSQIGATISKWHYACEEEDEATLKNNVYSAGPLSICVDAANWQDYTGGIMSGWQCAWINELDHCVQAVGYDTSSSSPYWLVRNSWGTDWGELGYIRLQYGDNTCGLTNEATYVVV
jgi:C1A family cysteine protease